jgi:hypothetical protein
MAVSSTLSSGFVDFDDRVVAMVGLQLSAVPRRSPWSHSILRSDVTLNVTLDYSARFVGQGDVAIRPGFNDAPMDVKRLF